MCSPKVISHGLPLLHHDQPLLHSKVISHSLPPINHGHPLPSKVISHSLPLLHQGPSQSSKVVSHGLPLLSFSPFETLPSPLTHQLKPEVEQPHTYFHSLQYNDDPYEAQNYVSKHLVSRSKQFGTLVKQISHPLHILCCRSPNTTTLSTLCKTPTLVIITPTVRRRLTILLRGSIEYCYQMAGCR
jgi:hypothetical protein